MNGWRYMVFEAQSLYSPAVLPWQKGTLDHLLGMYRSNRLPHALLLAGPAGCGKGVFAASLASILLCRAVDASGSDIAPCGSCEGCNLVQAGSHGDMRWLAPEEGKRAIGVEPIREAIRFVQRTAGYGEHKVLVISPAEAMTTAAANALLKTLEEPAGNSVICLVCHQPSDLPATVRSRCQTITFPAPAFESGLAWLQNELGDNDQAYRALKLAEGRPIEALRLATTGAVDGLVSIRETLSSVLNRTHSATTATQRLAGAELDIILAAAAVIVEIKLKDTASLQDLGRYRQLFRVRDDIEQWSGAVRRGVNLARDGLVAHLCNRLYSALPPGV